LHRVQPMSDWAPSIAALLALIYFLLFPAQFGEILAWVARVFW
jgi:hypothetical protein